MASIYRIIPILLIAILLKQGVGAQEISVGISNYVTMAKSNDFGIDFLYTKAFKNKRILLGIELRSIEWGNHLGFVLGYQALEYSLGSFNNGGKIALHPGLALFHQGSLGSYGISFTHYLQWQFNKRNHLQLDIGLRYNISPAYKDYGIYRQFEVPVGVRWGIAFNED